MSVDGSQAARRTIDLAHELHTLASTDRFRSMFFEEARELLLTLESGLMELEAKQGERTHLDKTFRAAHSLKGAAGMVGMAAIAEFTHSVEAVLDAIRSGNVPVSQAAISVLLAARDHLAAAVDAEESGQSLPLPTALHGQLEAILRGDLKAIPAVDTEASDAPTASSWSTRILLNPRPDILERGIDPLGLLDELRELGPTRIAVDTSRLPDLASLDPTRCHLAWTIDLEAKLSRSDLDEIFLFLGEPDQVEVLSLGATETRSVELPPKVEEGRASELAETPAKPPPALTAAPSRVRVEAVQLDQLVGLAGELAILTDNLQGLADLPWAENWTGTIEALENVGHKLRDMALELRMVPVEDLFARLPRMVRDLADRCGKQIHLKIEGEETRLDRTIIDRLAEPMIHLIRNAVDHGLETPDERQAVGKSPAGQIIVRAGHEGDRVAIRIIDDGRGLDRERIARKGVAAGLIPPETSPDDPRVVNLIFEAGFTTRDQVSDLSGRGVGLDVVGDTIRSLRGTLTVESTRGRGTTFLLHLPLTLALIDGLLVETAGHRYVVPLSQVEECVAMDASATGSPTGRSYLVVRDEMVPVVPLRRVFKSAGSAPSRQELLVTSQAGRRVGVAVDRLLGRVQAVIHPLDEELGRLGRFSGTTILGDGSVSLILDLATLIADAQRAEPVAIAARGGEHH